jgi:hypothetical protein
MSLLDKASLVVTPNAYKTSKLYSVVPSDGSGDMTVVRATTATRVNSAGLIEEVPRNLIENSQVLNVAYWSKDLTTVIDNNTTAPNGTTTASKLTETAGTGSHHIHNASGSFIPIVGASYSMSCFVKLPSTAAGRFVQLPFFIAGFGSNAYVNFDLLNGVVGTIGSSITSSSITVIGDGWYRISASALATATGSSGFQISFITASSSARTQSYTVTAGSEKAIFLYGLQIEAGATTEYFPTTTRLNIPRIDYTNGSCPSLLVEPQRTNLALRSEQFDNAYWTKSNSTISANSIISPSGIQNADKLIENNGTGAKWVFFTPTVTTGSTYTYSIYAKKAERNFVYINAFSGTAKITWFNLNTGTVGTSQSGIASIQNVGNGWYKCSLTITIVAGTQFYLVGVSNADSVADYTGNGTSGIHIWGAQLELGSYPTSYIPTVASTVTRNADVISKTGISSLIGQSIGTIFCEFVVYNNNDAIPFNLVNNNWNSGASMYLQINNSGNFQITGFNNTILIIAFDTGIPAVKGQRYKCALVYNNTTIKLFINGALITTNTIATPVVANNLFLSLLDSGIEKYGQNYNSLQLYKTALSDSECNNLTTL